MRRFALIVATAVAASSFAQGPGFGLTGKTMLLAMPEVKKELKLTKDQEAGIKKTTDDMQKNPMAYGGMPSMQYVTKAIDAKVVPILDEGQRARLEEIWLQSNGMTALIEDEASGPLGLSDDTKAEVKKLAKGYFDKQMEKIMATQHTHKYDQKAAKKERGDVNATIAALLSEEQKTKWKAMLGQPFKFPKGWND